MILNDFMLYKNSDQLEEIESDSIHVSGKQEKFHPLGIYSEQIFGPVKNFKCQCGKTFGKINEGKLCSECGVMCLSNEVRNKIFAKIVLPDNIYYLNPILADTMKKLFGKNAVTSLINKKNYLDNKENPYFFSLEKKRLIKKSKLKGNEKIIEKPIFDITSLRHLFEEINDDDNVELSGIKRYIDDNLTYPEYKNYFFLNYVLVTPPDSRPIIKINATKMLPHPVSKVYRQIINSKKNISDNLYQENSNHFGYTVYKYQEMVEEVYGVVLDYNFQKKESYVKESLTGKTIEFSQRAVIIPNPALKPYQVGLSEESVKKLFMPNILHFLNKKYEENNLANHGFTINDFVQYVYSSLDVDGITKLKISDEEFMEFIQEETKKDKLKMLIERQPVLQKENTCLFNLGKIFKENDLFYKEDKNESSSD